MKPSPWPINKPFPVAMTDADLMSVLQIGKSRFYVLKADGKFDRFKLTDPIGHACWSGPKVNAWINREHAPVTRSFRKAHGRRPVAVAS